MLTHLINKTKEAIVIILIVFFLGLLIPMLITTLCIIFNSANASYAEAFGSGVFWIFTALGWAISCVYINEELKHINNIKS